MVHKLPKPLLFKLLCQFRKASDIIGKNDMLMGLDYKNTIKQFHDCLGDEYAIGEDEILFTSDVEFESVPEDLL